MQPLIDIIAQLNEDERNDFTSWFSSLNKKERETVASVLARTTLDRIRTVLSVPSENRVALFLVQTDSSEEFRNGGKQFLKKQLNDLKKKFEKN